MKTDYDVIVVGGGWGGVCASISASRQGVSVLLIERDSCLGGTATVSEVCEIDGGYTKDGRCVMPAAAREILEAGIARGCVRKDGWIAMSSDPAHGCDRIRFNPEEMKLLLDEAVQKAGVDVLYLTQLKSVTETPDGVELVIGNVYSKIRVKGKILIDATGNSEAVYMLNPDATVKTDVSERQGVTLIFRLGNVDMEKYRTNITPAKLTDVISRGIESGAMTVRILATCMLPGMDEISVSATRAVDIDMEDPVSATKALQETRLQVRKCIPFLKENLAGLENAHLSSIAASLGVRERRRIRGLAQITGEMVLKAERSYDAVAFGCYPVDIHRSVGKLAVQFTDIGGNGIYSIPLSSMISSEYPNVICGCKAIDSDSTAFAAHRTMPSVMGIGNAAGIAAALAVKLGIDLRTLDPSEVRVLLKPEYPDCQDLL